MTNVTDILRRSKRLTAAEIAFRGGELLRSAAERVGAAPRPRLRGGPGIDASALAPEVLAPSLAAGAGAIEAWTHLFPDSVERAKREADAVLGGAIPVFSDRVECGARVDWLADYRSGARAPLSFGRAIDLVDPRSPFDAKNVWELNRFNYLLPLGMAYGATGDRRYYEGWKRLVGSWIDGNPPDRGVNWASSLELAIRSINWLWSGWFFARELEGDAAFARRFGESILLHGDRISRHLSYWFSPNTHLTGEALGLLYIGKAYPRAASARRWAELGERILREELPRQVLGDGGYFERATWYHKYTIDFYLHLLLLAGGPDPSTDEAAPAIARSVRHLVLLSERDGTIPVIGDADGGQLLVLDGRKGNVRGACCAAAALLGDPELKSLAGEEIQEEALWLLGAAGIDRFQSLRARDPRSYHSLGGETGWYCVRTGMRREDSFVVFDCGPHGWEGCGHAHADLLSTIWCDRGSMVLVDPGNPAYGGDTDLRDRMRSSQSHNTVSIGGESQSLPGGLFRWRRVAAPVEPSADVDGEYGWLEGQHDGYDRLGCRHWRGVLLFGRDLLAIADWVRCARPAAPILWNLQFAPGTLEAAADGLFRFVPSVGGGPRSIRVFGSAAPAPRAAGGIVSRDYNQKVAAPRLSWELGGLRGDALTLTVLSSDAAGIASMRFDGRGAVEGAAGGTRYALRIEAPPAWTAAGEAGSLRPRVTASAERDGERRVLSMRAGGPDGWRREPARREGRP